MNNDLNENLRELCSIGDLTVIKNYVENFRQKIDINSQNRVNGW